MEKKISKKCFLVVEHYEGFIDAGPLSLELARVTHVSGCCFALLWQADAFCSCAGDGFSSERRNKLCSPLRSGAGHLAPAGAWCCTPVSISCGNSNVQPAHLGKTQCSFLGWAEVRWGINSRIIKFGTDLQDHQVQLPTQPQHAC